MEFVWKNQAQPVSMKRFLLTHGVSMRMIKSIKSGTGTFLLAGQPVSGAITVATDVVAGIRVPDETADAEVAVSQAPIAVLAEDQNWLVVDKPAGLTSVPGPSNREDTLVNRVKGYLVQTQAKNLRPHLVTRLDRDTSGVVVVAKHRLAQSVAMQAATQKTYLAVVAGQLEDDHNLIDLPIGRPGTDPRRAVMEDGQQAKTEYWVLARLPHATVVKVLLHTGRTHQIRVHFAAIGHPLLGDHLYDGPMDQGIERQALHAWQYELPDILADHTHKWVAPIPNDLVPFVPAELKK